MGFAGGQRVRRDRWDCRIDEVEWLDMEGARTVEGSRGKAALVMWFSPMLPLYAKLRRRMYTFRAFKFEQRPLETERCMVMEFPVSTFFKTTIS